MLEASIMPNSRQLGYLMRGTWLYCTWEHASTNLVELRLSTGESFP